VCDGGECVLEGNQLVFMSDIPAYDYVTVVLKETDA
jgi:hypothetical protein